ncbi:hypothetical protein MUK42_12877 [Musa troglodytarum]|uniref:Uncharacterized protein n=1 Tax=Musa troglodytarum TaxID=320322 RepID=A0A9E7GPD4_9LILI|nr:hypothetical protein MUK42_12877 [Musa troglodytarum]
MATVVDSTPVSLSIRYQKPDPYCPSGLEMGRTRSAGSR